MAQNLNPITGCINPNRGQNSYLPSWTQTCLDPSSGLSNPSINSLLNEIDNNAQSKIAITVSHSCNTDFRCDGTNDEVEINEAITLANSTGRNKVILIPDGNYIISSSIIMKSGVTLDGYNSVLDIYNPILFKEEHSTVKNIRILEKSSLFSFGDASNTAYYSKVENIDIYQTNVSSIAFDIIRAVGTEINDIRILGTNKTVASYLFVLQQNTSKTCISKLNMFSGVGAETIYINGSVEVMVKDCYLYKQANPISDRSIIIVNGINVSFNNTSLWNNLTPAQSPIYAQNSSLVKFVNNTITASAATSIYALDLVNPSQWIVSGNVISSYNTTNSSIVGLTGTVTHTNLNQVN